MRLDEILDGHIRNMNQVVEGRRRVVPVEAPQDEGQIRVVHEIVAPDGRQLHIIRDERGRYHNIFDARGNHDAIMMFLRQRQNRERRVDLALGDEFN